MSLLAAAIVLAIVALIFGFVTAVKWLFIIAAVLVILGLVSYFVGGRTRTGT